MATIIISRPHEQQPERLALVEELACNLASSGHRVLLAPDLYHLPDDSEIWHRIAEATTPVAVLGWLHPRAMEWLLHRRGVACECWQIVNLTGAASADAVLSDIPTAEAGGEAETIEGDTQTRWYPVVDLSRCTNCGHCLQFCLFGVYELDEADQVRVTQPDSCKAGCPACSRICPSSAIMFPLYHQDAAIAGAPDQFVERDAEARRMFYSRTEQPCPLCALKTDAEIASITTDDCCPECGRKLDAYQPEPSATLDEIDALIDRLDELRGER
ncbi:MAG: ATP-binding protein [Armatimonadota bacterium]